MSRNITRTSSLLWHPIWIKIRMAVDGCLQGPDKPSPEEIAAFAGISYPQYLNVLDRSATLEPHEVEHLISVCTALASGADHVPVFAGSQSSRRTLRLSAADVAQIQELLRPYQAIRGAGAAFLSFVAESGIRLLDAKMPTGPVPGILRPPDGSTQIVLFAHPDLIVTAFHRSRAFRRAGLTMAGGSISALYLANAISLALRDPGIIAKAMQQIPAPLPEGTAVRFRPRSEDLQAVSDGVAPGDDLRGRMIEIIQVALTRYDRMVEKPLIPERMPRGSLAESRQVTLSLEGDLFTRVEGLAAAQGRSLPAAISMLLTLGLQPETEPLASPERPAVGTHRRTTATASRRSR
jgi:hypothetical protein